jgi:hypothetical protein
MKNQGKITYSDKVKDRSNDPYFVKKAEESLKDFKKYGIPAEILRIQAERLKK